MAPDIHKRCVVAKDYVGCVKAMTGDLGQPSRVIVQEGASLPESNKCPDGMAYLGGSTCRDVICDVGFFVGHDPLLGGKDWSCSSGYVLRLGEVTAKSYYDKDCPAIKFEAG
ncbi:hypothetical protein KBY72_12825 [Cyanobium sp. BA5m-21]|uniref:hypothetical protein n=1 Tax=unclassified Cyanobium TaxID=2627006 RepID=UPI0020CF1832|nr:MULTISPECIES: hypothetical protein [unclassified Cyanobium]MCP9903536.1 hypothetical protein [Cyanobium sp. BA5m-10]MCP9908052.1 hypothetical protein [Cyanobium sp. BA5m-21]